MSAHPLMVQLKAERIRRGLTLGQAATAAGISQAALGYWEAGTQQPTLTLLDDYMASFGLCFKAAYVVEDADLGEQIPFEDEVVGLGEKWCRTCEQIRSLEYGFHRDKTRRDGRMSQCRYCAKDRRERLKAVAA
jgi:transcriptional regulator with XRE-family HTH domain